MSAVTTSDSAPNYRPTIVLVIAIMAATFAAPFIKLTQEAGMPSPLVAAGRLTLSALALTPLVLTRYGDELRHLTRRDLLLAMFAGFWVGAHFLLLIYALEYTTIMLTQVIVNTGPIWVALLETTVLKTKLDKRVWIGLAVAMAGGLFIAATVGSPTADASNPLLGNVLALSGSIGGALYITTGRNVRSKVSMLPYVWIVFGTGGLLTLAYTLTSGIPLTGHPPASYGWLLMLTLVPQLIGHSGFNYVLGYIKATTVTLTTQVVTVTATIVAFLIFGEVPTVANIIGGAILVTGVVIAITQRTTPDQRPTSSPE